MRTSTRRGIVLLVALAMIAGCVSVARAQPVEDAITVDAAVQQLVDLHILLAPPTETFSWTVR